MMQSDMFGLGDGDLCGHKRWRVMLSDDDPMLPQWSDDNTNSDFTAVGDFVDFSGGSSASGEAAAAHGRRFLSDSVSGEVLFHPVSADVRSDQISTNPVDFGGVFVSQQLPSNFHGNSSTNPMQPQQQQQQASALGVGIRRKSRISSPVPPEQPLAPKQRGRPVKITCRSKKAMYARAYRNKLKEQMLSYEQCNAEKDMQIKALIAERDALRESLFILNDKFENLKAFVSNDALRNSSEVVINCLINDGE